MLVSQLNPKIIMTEKLSRAFQYGSGWTRIISIEEGKVVEEIIVRGEMYPCFIIDKREREITKPEEFLVVIRDLLS